MPHPAGVGDPTTKGRWLGANRTPGYSSNPDVPDGVYGVHATLLHTGRVLLFSGYYEESGYAYRSWSWDPDEPIEDAIGRWFVPGFDGEGAGEDPDPPHEPPPTPDDDPDIDLFCAHHVQLEDGRLLVVGGDTRSGHDNRGLHIYDPLRERWSKLPDRMMAGRWYPTAVTMADGRVAIFSGHSHGPLVAGGPHEHGILEEVEVVAPPRYTPQVVTGGRRLLFTYPGLVLVRGGGIAYVPTAWEYDDDYFTDTNGAIADLGSSGEFRFTGRTTGAWVPPADRDPPILPDVPLREEGTFVLLPPARDGRVLVIGGGFIRSNNQVADAEPETCEILQTQSATPTWTLAGSMHHQRVNVNAVLLPDGKVFIVGGHDNYKWDTGHGHVKVAELYDSTVAFDPADPQAAFTEVAEMHQPRIYHSCALLLPDGRVMVVGGEHSETEDDAGHTHDVNTDNKTYELYEPPYLHQGEQPTITAIGRPDGPDDEALYGGLLVVDYTVAERATIDKVVFIRPCSATHHTDTDQRWEDASFRHGRDGQLLVEVPSDPSVLPPGYYMLWILDDQGRPCERAPFVRVSGRHCRLITDRSHVSLDEYEGAVATGDASFDAAFYVTLHGFVPSELGITDATPGPAEVAAWSPAISFADDGADLDGALEAEPTALHLEVASTPDVDTLDVRQRVTFEYRLRVSDPSVFPPEPADPTELALRTVMLTTSRAGFTCRGELTLTRQPNPYLTDGSTYWLSQDVRVFAIREGASIGGVDWEPGDTPLTYLQRYLDRCGTAAEVEAIHPFDRLPEDQQASRLYIEDEVDGDRVHNFAVARVRYRGNAESAANVRAFFRMFTTAVTTMAYAPGTYPRSEAPAPPYARPGRLGDEIVTIPFYGIPRGDVAAGGDTLNVHTLAPVPGGESRTYYGAWLDFNRDAADVVDPGDPSTTVNIRNLIRGKHQCLVCELVYDRDPIPIGATPAGNDNLSQRNLAIEGSENPGGPDSHTVLLTFDVAPTSPKQIRRPDRDDAVVASHALAPAGPAGMPLHGPIATVLEAPDELLIDWGSLPRDAEATLYLPQLDADAMIAQAHRDHGVIRLERVDAHTIRCRVADVAWIPIPATGQRRIAGLLTITLPPSVRVGDEYRVVVRHVSRIEDRVLGSFELRVPVTTADRLVDDDLRTLWVLRDIAATVPHGSRWRPIMDRYITGLDRRARSLGGDPDAGPGRPGPGEGRGDGDAGPGPGRGDAWRRRCGWLVGALVVAKVLWRCLCRGSDRRRD